jgi:hypothetical protein
VVVHVAEAVGTATEALVIRGIRRESRCARVLWQEVATGALIGALLAVVFFPFAVAPGGNTSLGVAVALSLLACTASNSVVALVLAIPAWRYRYDKFGWTTRSSQLYADRLLRWGSPCSTSGSWWCSSGT